jgi:hypothetical protein
VFSGEIRSLRSMCEKEILVVYLSTEGFLEGNNVVNTVSIENCYIVFVIKINTINVWIVVHESCKLFSDCNGISSWITSSTKSTDEELFTISMHGIEDVLLNFCIG